MAGLGADALDGILGDTSPEERAAAGDTTAAAKASTINWVPWRSADTPTHQSVEDWRRGKFTSPSQSDIQAAEVRRLLDTEEAKSGGDPRLATPAEKAEGMWDPETGFGLNDMEARAAKHQALLEGNTPILKDAKDVAGAILSMTAPELKAITDKMVAAGMIDEGANMSQIQDKWHELIGNAVDWNNANPTAMMTPVDMITLMHGDGKGGAQKKVSDVVSKSVSISTNEQARSMLRQMMAQQLGRRPTQTEVDDFQGSLNEAQRANPQVTTRHSELNAAGNETNSSSVTTGGLDEGEFAYDAVTSTDPDSEYGKYQQATSYYNAFLQAVRGPGGST